MPSSCGRVLTSPLQPDSIWMPTLPCRQHPLALWDRQSGLKNRVREGPGSSVSQSPHRFPVIVIAELPSAFAPLPRRDPNGAATAGKPPRAPHLKPLTVIRVDFPTNPREKLELFLAYSPSALRREGVFEGIVSLMTTESMTSSGWASSQAVHGTSPGTSPFERRSVLTAGISRSRRTFRIFSNRLPMRGHWRKSACLAWAGSTKDGTTRLRSPVSATLLPPVQPLWRCGPVGIGPDNDVRFGRLASVLPS